MSAGYQVRCAVCNDLLTILPVQVRVKLKWHCACGTTNTIHVGGREQELQRDKHTAEALRA